MAKMIEKVGRWDIAGLFTRNLRRDIAEEMEVALKQIGSETEGLMKKFIRNQSGFSNPEAKWEPLSKAYAAYKKKTKGLSTKTLIATSSMLQSITSVASYPRVFVGVKRGAKGKEGEELANIAAIMEYGSKSRNIPARPFIAPVADFQMMRIQRGNLLGKRIIAHLKKKYGM